MAAEDLVKIRSAVTELVASGILMAPAAEQVQALLLQLLGECERKKQRASAAISTLQQQISVTNGEIQAWSAMGSIVESLLNAHLERARTAAAEEAKKKAEEAGVSSDRQVAIEREKAKEGLLTSQEEPVGAPTPGKVRKRASKK